jgi:hypothetical protein
MYAPEGVNQDTRKKDETMKMFENIFVIPMHFMRVDDLWPQVLDLTGKIE